MTSKVEFRSLQLRKEYKEILDQLCVQYGLNRSEFLGALLKYVLESDVKVVHEPASITIHLSSKGSLKGDLGIPISQKSEASQ